MKQFSRMPYKESQLSFILIRMQSQIFLKHALCHTPYFNSVLAKSEVPATLYGISSSGWMDQELFADWFLHHFLEHAPVGC